MAELDSLTLQMLRQIDRKLDSLLDRLSGDRTSANSDPKPLSACAKEIAALTPRAVRQTDAVDLLHEDRAR